MIHAIVVPVPPVGCQSQKSQIKFCVIELDFICVMTQYEAYAILNSMYRVGQGKGLNKNKNQYFHNYLVFYFQIQALNMVYTDDTVF